MSHVKSNCELLLYDSACRACTLASSTVNTGIRINNILAVTFSNCAYRALSFACSAAYAIISNNTCHNKTSL